MAGNGPNGLMTRDILEARDKCATSPTKKQYPTQAAAEQAAEWRTREAGISIQAYACPDCGFFHLSRTSRLDRVLPQVDGAIQTASMRRPHLAPAPVERVDMSEIIAMESPVVAGNKAAREKLLAEYLEGRESVTIPEIQEYLNGSPYIANSTLHALGWEGRKGQPNWYPPGTPLVATPKPESIARQQRRLAKNPKRGPALHRARLRALKLYLADRTEVTSAEVMAHLEAGKDQTKALLMDAGWALTGRGVTARWVPNEGLSTLQQVMPARTRALHAVEPEYTDSSEAVASKAAENVTSIEHSMERHPAGNDLGWRPVPSLEALQLKQVNTIIEELAVYGLEMRIEIREKR